MVSDALSRILEEASVTGVSRRPVASLLSDLDEIFQSAIGAGLWDVLSRTLRDRGGVDWITVNVDFPNQGVHLSVITHSELVEGVREGRINPNTILANVVRADEKQGTKIYIILSPPVTFGRRIEG